MVLCNRLLAVESRCALGMGVLGNLSFQMHKCGVSCIEVSSLYGLLLLATYPFGCTSFVSVQVGYVYMRQMYWCALAGTYVYKFVGTCERIYPCRL